MACLDSSMVQADKTIPQQKTYPDSLRARLGKAPMHAASGLQVDLVKGVALRLEPLPAAGGSVEVLPHPGSWEPAQA